ncbi:DUF3320 domain-containing protein [Mesorhizobium sp. CAU 1741]|uniref:DUF3320 domain-containing protein n=1 Tax=Mesorhizobium sp. CAU 1741 TaxID=3140366 RepID=UPI00325A6681
MLDRAERLSVRVLESARLKLLETGTRNRLVHVNRANQRANCLNIVNEDSDAVFDLLRIQSKRMRFKAMGKDRHQDEETVVLYDGDVVALADPPGSDRLTDLLLETPLGPEAQTRRLLRLAHDAKTAEEEQGLNILYLALGFLKWRESSSSEIWREAPLVLLPVELVRNDRTSTFDVRSRDDEITTNLPLQERLRQDFGILLPEVEDAEEWCPSEYFSDVVEAVSGQPGWSIDGNGIQLGFFSFAKLLMHRDLDPATWPDGELTDNPLLSGLLKEGFEPDEPMFGPEDKLDQFLDPADIIQVVDADASQTKVIEEVRRGANLVVQGPPGTGKSQTITNLIAAAAHDGKTVLFVAEKMAALSVVHQRLVRAGLRDVCLELHSRSANKKALAQELGRTLMASGSAVVTANEADALRAKRDRLNQISDLLHSPIAGTSDTPFDAMSEIIGLIGKGVPPPSLTLDGLEKLDKNARQRARETIRRLLEALQTVGCIEAHPFKGTGNHHLQPTDLSRLEGELAAATKCLSQLLEMIERNAVVIRQPNPENIVDIERLLRALDLFANAPDFASEQLTPSLFDCVGQPRLEEALLAGAEWAAAHNAAQDVFTQVAFSSDARQIRGAIAEGSRSLWARVFGPYRKACSELSTLTSIAIPKSPSERLAIVDQLVEVQELRRRLADDEGWLPGVLGSNWRGERTDFARLQALVEWAKNVRSAGYESASEICAVLNGVRAPSETANSLRGLRNEMLSGAQRVVDRLSLDIAVAGFGSELAHASLSQLLRAMESMRDAPDRYTEWATLARVYGEVQEIGAGRLIQALDEGSVLPEGAEEEFFFACAEARWNAARASRPELAQLEGLDRSELVRLFQESERKRLSDAQKLILSQHYAQIPRGSMGEMAIIRGEIGRKSRHKPIRWVMKNAGSMLQRIKPVMLMSPISVAQFLPPGSVTFDLLVIDEASQIRPEDALGVVARARQIVVVGDQKQLPPTSFFDRLIDEGEDLEDEDDEVPVGATAADMESILSLCEARGLRSRMLEWHYRSRDPSLIRVSNAEFYDDRLVLPPSPLQLDPNFGLRFHRVPGVYSRGKAAAARAGTNRIEAEHVARAVAEHARTHPELSLGVVAFSKSQSSMLTEVLEHERRKDAVLDAFLREGYAEDVFVKNIENVQGDERDVILISVGYGPQQPNGRLASQSFGPINGEGGERRLNVLFSRARVRCEVFASFDPGDINATRSSRDGPRVLKRFLDFARTGIIEERVPTGLASDSPFEEDVLEVIRRFGYEADPQVGTAGFRIDIGVRHPDRPGHYLIAVECDGAAYHSALWARERDRLRQDVLEGLGWRFHRIWSTDWFYRRSFEIKKLEKILREATVAASDGIELRGSRGHGHSVVAELESAAPEQFDVDHLQLSAPAYQRADIASSRMEEPHEAPMEHLADLVAEIVSVEGPIHADEVARRISAAFGKVRTGNRIVEATMRAVRVARQRDANLLQLGAFLATADQVAAPPVRDRRAETGSVLKAEYLPPIEIEAAAKKIQAESGMMLPEEMTRAVARLLGFQRVGPDLSEAIISVVVDRGS